MKTIEQTQFIKDYIEFISTAKTERLCVEEAEKIALLNGFLPYDNSKEYKYGDKVYFKNKKISGF